MKLAAAAVAPCASASSSTFSRRRLTAAPAPPLRCMPPSLQRPAVHPVSLFSLVLFLGLDSTRSTPMQSERQERVAHSAFSPFNLKKQTTPTQWRRLPSTSAAAALRVPDAAAAAFSFPAVVICAACAPGPLLFALGAGAAALADAVLAAVAAFAARAAAAWPVLLVFTVAVGWASRGVGLSSSTNSSSSRLSESRKLREALAEHSETLAGIERGISVSWKKREHFNWFQTCSSKLAKEKKRHASPSSPRFHSPTNQQNQPTNHARSHFRSSTAT